jgi:hypothetical protein
MFLQAPQRPRPVSLSVVVLVTVLAATSQAQSPTAFERAWQDGMPATITGELTVLVADDFERNRSELMHLIRDSRTGRSFRIRLDRGAPAHWHSGIVVTVSGRTNGSEFYILAASTDPNTTLSTSTASLTAPNATGDQKTLVIVANFRDKSIACSASEVADLMFTSPLGRSVNDLYRESSWGKTSFSGTVVGPYTMDYASTDACDLSAWATAANAAAASSVNVNEYPRKVYVMPTNSCPAAGVADVGVSPSRSWVFTCSLPDVFAHELGHNLGMHHASTPDGEYRDVSDFMGQSEGMIRQVNAPHKLQMGWLPDAQAPTIAQDGLYDVAPLEVDPATAVAPQSLKVYKGDTDEYYYLSYRVAIGFDAILACCEYLDRLSVHSWSGTGRTILLALLDDGETFSDAATGFSVTQVNHSALSATADIRLGAPCGVAPPTVSMTPRDHIGSPGDARTYDVSVLNNDAPGCPEGTFSLDADAPAGWTTGFSAGNLQLAPGGNAQAGLTVTPPANAVSGTYTIDVHASDMSTSALTGTASGTYGVLGCTRDAPAVTVSPSTQTGLPGARLIYGISVANRDSPACGDSTFSLASAVALGWSATPSSPSLNLAAGMTGTLTLEVTSPVGSTVGGHLVSVNASDSLLAVHAVSSVAIYVVGDAVPPTAPSGLTASVARRAVSLTWRAATDNVAVAGYTVWRNGTVLATTTGTGWVDATMAQGSGYIYFVVAHDAMGNASPPSNSVTAGATSKRK